MAPDNKANQKHQMTQLLQSGRYSDCKVVCGNRSFAVHKAIVWERCDIICAAMSKGWKEEAEKRFSIPHDTYDPEAVHGALFYLYTFTYPKDIKTKIEYDLASHPGVNSEYWTRLGKHYWLYDLELYKVAHYLGLKPLVKFAKEKLDERCTNPSAALFRSRISGYVSLVDQLYYKTDKHKKQEGYDEKEIYADLLKGTRRLLLASTAQLVAENIKEEALDRVTQENQDFKKDVFSVLAEQHRFLALASPSTLTFDPESQPPTTGW